MHSFLWVVPIWESGGVVGVVSVCCCFMNCFMNDNKIVKVRKQDRVLSREEN